MSSLKKRVERLERAQGKGGLTIIIINDGETEEEVLQRYRAKNPEHENGGVIMLIGPLDQAPPSAPTPPRSEPQPRPSVWEPGRPIMISR